MLLRTLIFLVDVTRRKNLKFLAIYSLCSRISSCIGLHGILLTPSPTDTARNSNSITSNLQEHMFCQSACILLAAEYLLNEPEDNFVQLPSFLILYTVPSLKNSPFFVKKGGGEILCNISILIYTKELRVTLKSKVSPYQFITHFPGSIMLSVSKTLGQLSRVPHTKTS